MVRIAFLGYGTVGRALHALLENRRARLAREHEIEWVVAGIATRSLGWGASAGVYEWLAQCRADVVFEAIPLDPHAGQPALDYIRAIIAHGAHAISANKGPVVHGYRELTTLAAAHGVQYRFESAVMDGAPVFSLVRSCLPLAGLHAMRGVFTSTATVVLEAVEQGRSFEEGIAHAQQLGIAEADPAYDVDGWDSAVKLCALANVIFSGDLRPADVARTGIRELREDEIREAARQGSPYRLIGAVARDAAGRIAAHVAPSRCDPGGAIGIARGATLVIHYEGDVFPGGLTVTSRDPDPTTTAYGMLADLVSILA